MSRKVRITTQELREIAKRQRAERELAERLRRIRTFAYIAASPR